MASVGFEPEEHPGVMLAITVPNAADGFGDARLRYVDLASGRLLAGEAESGKTLTGFLLDLHAQWFLGPVGELVGALIALLVLLSLLSGLVVYAPYVKRIAFGALRRGRGPRLLQLDLHNFVGALMLGWALVVTVTGLALGFGTVAIGVWQMTELAELRAERAGAALDPRRPPAGIDRAFAAAEATAEPGWRVVSVIYPRTEFSTGRHYTALVAGQGLDERLFRVVLVDAGTGQVAAAMALPWRSCWRSRCTSATTAGWR